MKILLAEDDPLHRELVETILTRRGHRVVAFSDGDPCPARLDEEDFDLMITDLFMPDMDGVQLVLAIRSRGHTLPIIGMTGGYSTIVKPYVSGMLKMGMDVVLRKPFTEKELLDLVEVVTNPGRESSCA